MLKPEQITHINIVNWFNEKYPEYADDLHHFANERKCSIQEGVILKRMGVKKGVADFFLALPINKYHGLWMELKTGKNKLSAEQIKFLERKKIRKYMTATVRGLEEAIEIIEIYLNS